MTACNPYIDLKKGVASAGFMSKSQAFAGKMKMADGSTASWSSVGSDSTDVPIAGINAIATGIAVNAAFKTQQSNNMLDATKDTNAANVTNTTTKANAAVQINGQNTAVETAKIVK